MSDEVMLAIVGLGGTLIAALIAFMHRADKRAEKSHDAHIASLESQTQLSKDQHERYAAEIGSLTKSSKKVDGTMEAVLEELKVLNKLVTSIEGHRLEESIARKDETALHREALSEIKKLGEAVALLAKGKDRK